MKIGFIGVGVIASAVVTGLSYDTEEVYDIFLSPRNADRAEKLSNTYSNVKKCNSNQEVIDCSDIIVLALVPAMAENILSDLTFRENQTIISFMSDFPIDRVKKIVGNVGKVVRILPLPFAARKIGPVVLCPPDEEVKRIFSETGNVVEITEEDKMETMFAITGLMSAFYGLTWDVVSWGESAGLERKEAVDYTTSFFEALCVQGRNVEGGDIGVLAEEYTPGGLNAMGLEIIRDQANAYEPWTEALNCILKRLKK